MQRIDGVQNFLVGALDTPTDQYLTVQLLLPVCGGELAELVDQDFGFARRDEFAGVDGIDEQLELGKLKRSTRSYSSRRRARAAARSDTWCRAGCLRCSGHRRRFCARRRRRAPAIFPTSWGTLQGVLLVGFPGEDLQKNKQFASLAFFARHNSGSFPESGRYNPILRPYRGGWRATGTAASREVLLSFGPQPYRPSSPKIHPRSSNRSPGSMAVMLRRLAQRSAAAPWSHTAQTAASSGVRPCFRPTASSPAVRPLKYPQLPPWLTRHCRSHHQTVPSGAATSV